MNDSTMFFDEKVFGRICDGTKTKCPKRLSFGKGEYQRYMVSNPSINFYARSLDEEHHVVKTGIRLAGIRWFTSFDLAMRRPILSTRKNKNNSKKGNHIFHASLYFSNVIKL